MIANFYTIIKKLKSEKGQSMVEYGLILLTIAMVVFVGLPALADALVNFFDICAAWFE